MVVFSVRVTYPVQVTGEPTLIRERLLTDIDGNF